jgi:hypothetical protein
MTAKKKPNRLGRPKTGERDAKVHFNMPRADAEWLKLRARQECRSITGQLLLCIRKVREMEQT